MPSDSTDVQELVWSDATHQAEMIRGGDVSAVELLDAYLGRIEELDGGIRSYVALDADSARSAARVVDDAVAAGRTDELGPFSGVTMSIKDVIDVVGLPTTQSCRALVDHRAEADSPLVARLRRAGFLIVGKTNIPEFCSSLTSSALNGTCRNPWDLNRTPGGSSGGAAAALAAGLCAISHGTDGGGSVRVPASFCGLVGVKPSRGLVVFGPNEDNPYFGLSVPGVLSRSVRDAARTLDAFAGHHERAPWLPRRDELPANTAAEKPTSLRIAITVDPPWGPVEEQCANAAFHAAKLLEAMGHAVDHATPSWETVLEVFGPMSVPGPAAFVSPDQLELLEPRNRQPVEEGWARSVVDHAEWARRCQERAREFMAFWNDFDVLVSPTVGMPPPPVDFVSWDLSPEDHSVRFAQMANFGPPFNVSGQPAVSVPMAWSEEGLPIGVQLAGRMFDEGTLLALAAQLEAARPASVRRPEAAAVSTT